jgi:hypothetical protein
MRIAASLLFASVAHAGAIAPIEVAFSDSIATETRERLWSKLRDGLAEAGFVLAEQTAVKDKLFASALPAGCVVGPCLVEVGKVLGVGHVLVGRIEGVESSFDVTLTALETGEGAVVAQATERCDVCGMVDVEATVRRAAVSIGAGLKTALAPKPKPKAEPIVTRQTAAVGRPAAVWRGWKWVALGVGAAAVGVGTYLTHIDGRCLDAACTDQRNTGTAGMISVGTGVTMMGAAGYLFLLRF